MIREILVNQKRIPIPVPLKTLRDLLIWVQNTLVRQDQEITKISLDGQDFTDYLFVADEASLDQDLSAESKVHLQVESASDLLLQEMDILHSYLVMAEKSLKLFLYDLLQESSEFSLLKMSRRFVEDCEMIQQLLSNLQSLADFASLPFDLDAADSFSNDLIEDLKDLTEELPPVDLARWLLKNIEPKLVSLQDQIHVQQPKLWSMISAKECRV